MLYLKHTIVIALCLIFNQANISAAKNTNSMPEIFFGMDATETSETTTTETTTPPAPEPKPVYIPSKYESISMSGESQYTKYDSYYDYELQDLVIIKSIIEHELRPSIGNISFILPETVDTDISSDINTESSQQNTASDSTQDQQHEPHQEKEQQPYDHLSEFTQEQRREQIQHIEEQKIKEYNTPHSDKRTVRNTIIKEKDFPSHGRLFAGDPRQFDSDIIVAKVHTLHDFNKISSLECMKRRFERFERHYDKLPPKGLITRQKPHKNQKEVAFLKALQSGEIPALCKRIETSPIEDAKNASNELQNLWGWPRTYTFLIPSIEHGTGEHCFVARLGVDIMRITERDLITRPDYIKKHTDQQSYNTVQEFKKQCAYLQQKNDMPALFDLKQESYRKVVKNGRNTNLTDNICLALAEKAFQDPINHVLGRVKHARTLKEARSVMEHFEQQLLDHMITENIACVPDLREKVIEQYGFDALKTIQEAYQARPDYVHSPNQSSALQGFSPILGIIQTKSLSIAHTELVHLKSQINDAFADRGITDPVAQQECLINNFGSDIVATAQSAYQSRPDVINIVTFFNPLDIQNASLRILETSNTYESVCDGFQILTDQVLENARLCEVECLPHVENHIVDSLHVMRSPKNPAEFVFHTTIVDHLLTDLQSQATAVVTGEPPVWNRAYGLLSTGLVTFFTHLNPIEQAKDWGSLAVSAGSLVETIASKTINKAQEALLDPIGTTQECLTMTADACKYLHNIAVGTCDAVTGIYYLPAEERLQRLESSYKAAGEIYKSIESQVTAEAVVKVGAKIAADFLFGRTVFKVGAYLNEIKAISKISNEVKVVARSLKSAVEEHPAFVTAEGVVLKMSNGVKNAGSAVKESALVKNIILKVANMEEFFELPFGQILNPHSLKTSIISGGQAVYRLTENIAKTRLKKGYYYYLDNLHKDHIEVFNKRKEFIGVYNLDGTFNVKKFEIAAKQGRRI